MISVPTSYRSPHDVQHVMKPGITMSKQDEEETAGCLQLFLFIEDYYFRYDAMGTKPATPFKIQIYLSGRVSGVVQYYQLQEIDLLLRNQLW